jgi:hypothetical protein
MKRLRHVQIGLVGKATMGIGLAAWLLAAPPAAAAQLLIGNVNATADSTRYSAPGGQNQYTIDSPGVGLGEQAAQVRMLAGTLFKLRVRVTTQNVPDSGTLEVMVRVNGTNTQLKCSVAGSGECSSGGKTKAVTNSSLMAVRISNDFVNPGSIAVTYSLFLEPALQ